MFILFKTGLRISEFCGLTLSDIDFEEKQISVNHQLQRTRGMKYIIEDTKTSSGTRIIPMTEEVYECFKRIVENRKKPKKEPVIDGYKGFLFLDKKDMPEVALHWEKTQSGQGVIVKQDGSTVFLLQVTKVGADPLPVCADGCSLPVSLIFGKIV